MFLAALFSLNALLAFIAILIALYFYLTKNFNYWKDRGIPGPKPVVVLGTMWEMFTKPIHQASFDNYKKYGKIYGEFGFSTPVLTIADPELIKDISIKDFHNFVDHSDMKSGDPLNDRSLFNLMGDEWKAMRSVISPTFSSGKMRAMHPMITDCVHRLDQYLETKAINGDELDVKRAMGNLTMDVIASCAFGTQIDVHNDNKTNEFVANAQQVLRGNWRLWFMFLMTTTFPKLTEKIGISTMKPSVEHFFRSAISSIISKRRSQRNSVKHRDYLQLMINAQNRSADNSEDQDIDDLNEHIFGTTDALKDQKTANVVITDDDMLATSFLFFVAGYETTATLLSFLTYELSLKEKCQQRLYEEINAFDGNYSYESIARMPYLEACIAETLRLYNPIAATSRIALDDYKLGNTGLTIPKGMMINFDVHSVHHSPEYYPNPDVWDPERFLPENRDQLVPYTYLPFGLGPRNCVGMRFALMEAKTAVAHLITKYRFKRTANTAVPLKYKKFEFLLTPEAIQIGVEKR
ncbi:unnamed protein product [Medioppia subpectinata]|uniref:Cytochrome P450 n=1 Tax=Medioppia subpectinata TaxID=1979941 RepID=A0A7R9KBN8_9ACAR|nr:unnamed protein product [Medioppia subpectinata]CAG2100140.1 unnamed protein product [Medioppia subpectinata]